MKNWTLKWLLSGIVFLFLLIPKFAIIGMILLTGYLGGAVAVHILASKPLFSYIFGIKLLLFNY